MNQVNIPNWLVNLASKKEALFIEPEKESMTLVEMLRFSIIAELDAINLYESFAAKTENELVRKVLLDVAREEKTHVGEFKKLLLELDPEQKEEMKEGFREVDELREEEQTDLPI